ncbi:MAG: hypothetical protein A2857_02555 [Candidatus Levybacteria bacterium RIFCSPHIGHO2_01_FULL_36_15]|nr:MAG: hypothetical protein A2857_02555 [Candidatus Levybacteria bacterium RIFCSPHIGHO2_01_FULL_36_15]OGH38869.1 MAG: hypothetical protein A2905_04270 [Candidatus Levybacteria bacterium RIFCSPLOWO2_01_FULL_36_10]
MNESVFSQNRDLLSGLIGENSDIGIIVGDPHNLDKVASGLALYLALSEAGKNVQVASKSEPIVEFSNLVGIDRIRKDFSGAVKTFTISLPYAEGEIEKVSYKIENEKLNINLFAGDQNISFSEKDIKYLKKGSLPSLIITIGVSSVEKLTNFFDFSSNVKLVNIDNSPENSGYGDIAFVGAGYSSISEMVTKIIHDLSIPMNIDISQNLLDGITAATENFSSYNTSPYAFEAVSYLLRNGAKRILSGRRQTAKKDFLRDLGEQRENLSVPVAQNNNQQPANNESTDEVPEDWFTPKVFRSSSKKQDE